METFTVILSEAKEPLAIIGLILMALTTTDPTVASLCAGALAGIVGIKATTTK